MPNCPKISQSTAKIILNWPKSNKIYQHFPKKTDKIGTKIWPKLAKKKKKKKKI